MRAYAFNKQRASYRRGLVLVMLVWCHPAIAAQKDLDFNRDIRPILSDHCYACHGPDEGKRKAGLRLDRQEEALKTLKSGNRAIVPGDVKRSTLVQRLTSRDPDELMPPQEEGKPLNAGQVESLIRWVKEGAKWKNHWSFIPPERPVLPKVREQDWPRDEIDYFILEQLEKKGLKPAPEADKATLIRRASFDLTGLPPTIGEVDAFLADDSPEAYEKLVDRLLSSVNYGERMAANWLDLARYADTSGYHFDGVRFMWLWRDWVIDAFNENKPYDTFTVEQLAGDLLPDPTREQRIATGFVRNNMTTDEGGSDPDEYLNKYVVDRVSTLGAVWLGMTVGCAECHDHKFDPLLTKEFYKLYAFFHNVPEKGLCPRPNKRCDLSRPTSASATLKRRCRTATTNSAKPRKNGNAKRTPDLRRNRVMKVCSLCSRSMTRSGPQRSPRRRSKPARRPRPSQNS